ncbi:Hypothetical predicted protein [Paramuricea clavata]|uniref:Uncharacterized protein n=1 Tax=Paramuricea clavata TaxID=317549 RepID=A0A7D9ERQ3_PARCT|nr:Hypothetical predicted protein [Paramuricea clavata]
MILYEKFKDMSQETSQIFKKLGQTICELRLKEDEDRYSPTPSGENNEPDTHAATKLLPRECRSPFPHLSQLDPSVPAYVPNMDTTLAPTLYPVITEPRLGSSSINLHHKYVGTRTDRQPGVFSGNRLKYTMWMKVFEALIEGRAINPAESLYFLRKHVSGEAKEVMNGFMLCMVTTRTLKAKEMQAKRFDDPFSSAVAAAFRKRLDEWKPITPGDATGLRKYVDILVQ